MTPILLIAALVLLAVGLRLVARGRGIRRDRGLADAPTLDLDNRTLFSARLGMAGRPDRIIRECGIPVPEEWKLGTRIHDSHRAQVGAYLLLIEEEAGVRPPRGYLALGSGEHVVVENTDELRAWVPEIAERIREARREPERTIPVRQPAFKCRKCGVRNHCGQRRD